MRGDFHQRLQDMLALLDCDLGASECHGMLCGILSGPARFDHRTWLSHLSGGEAFSTYEAGEPAVVLEQLFDQTRDALEEDEFGFALLLPAESADLHVRTTAFAAWCRGYLSGFGLSGVADLAALSEDARGFLNDVERFCAIALDADGSDDDERALTELTEFARMGVMIVREEAHVLAAGRT